MSSQSLQKRLPRAGFRSLRPALVLRVLALSSLMTAGLYATSDKELWINQKGVGSAVQYRQDEKGDRIPDFSPVGYQGGGVSLPSLPIKVVVQPAAGDAGARIQAALDFVAGLPADASGFRGAVLLAPGVFSISGHLELKASGVVLRGSGSGATGTVLVAAGVSRRALIQVGVPRLSPTHKAKPVEVVGDYVAVGSLELDVADASHLKAGMTVLVERPSTKEWIEAMDMDESPGPTVYFWRPGSVDTAWERTLVSVKGNHLVFDAPVTAALERRFGGGRVIPIEWDKRPEQIGVENLRIVSDFDAANPSDEEHAWVGLSLDGVANAWVDGVVAEHLVSSLVDVAPATRWITVRDCANLSPVSELAGYRRHAFLIQGQQVLVERCVSEAGLRDFVGGYMTAGPVVFHECQAVRSQGFSGAIGSFCTGFLFDNVDIDAGALRFDNLETANQGTGWSMVNCVAYQCTSSLLINRKPPVGHNWAIGVWGMYKGDGVWQTVNAYAEPKSLFRLQVEARFGSKGLAALAPTKFGVSSEGVPSLEQALPDLAQRLAPKPVAPGRPLSLQNGWLQGGDRLLFGRMADVNWWRGQMTPARSADEKPSLTRFAPGRTGQGLTDDLNEVASWLQKSGDVAYRHHYGLWYDRRRDDHERIRRADNEVFPPFYELPFARTGRGRTWNGLSLYDLTKYNPWYFGRLQEFAGLARENGLVLVNEMFFQHNILEAGAHWVDAPWRPANCIQETGFREPPFFEEGGKRIYMADTFYDVSNPVRRDIYRRYIRKCLENLADQPNVLHTLGEEYTGPLHFMQFWIDTVAEWERETGKHPLICLSATKDVQDAILADPARAAVIDVIDFKYWWKSPKGVYAPPGGQNKAPRQWEREWNGGKPRAADIASMVWDYRSRFPKKAIICGFGETEGWSALTSGASLPPLPRDTEPSLLASLSSMQPMGQPAGASANAWWLLNAETGSGLVYLPQGGDVNLPLGNGSQRPSQVFRLDVGTGRVSGSSTAVLEGASVKLSAETGHPAVLWFK